ncbi:hypothetical protein [Terasakiella sp.]|uniref:hypothetical protein n=1 Tax=Terasakiella sp. TaxID=2034861 RepID=UPI003AA92A96
MIFSVGDLIACEKTFLPVWESVEYQKPHCVTMDGNIVISNTGTPAGVYFRKTFESLDKVTIKISGKTIISPVTLRVKINNQLPKYLKAPNGDQFFTFENVNEIEFLFYADVEFKYLLKDIKIVENEKDAGRNPNIENLNAFFKEKFKIEPRLSKYGAGVLVKEKGKLIVKAENKGGGFFVNFHVNEPSILIFRGEDLGGKATIRYKNSNMNNYIYNKANKELEFFIPDATDVELLLFSDSNFSYEIKEINLSRCTECGTNKKLMARIEKDIPNIMSLIKSHPLDGARELLNWIAVNGDWTEESYIERKSYPILLTNSAGYAYFELFEKNRGAVFCGGLAVIYNKILHLYGYDSFVIDFGDAKGNLTHMTTVLAYKNDKNHLQFYMFDPMLNVVFKQRGTLEHISIFKIIENINNNKDSQIMIDSRSLEKRNWHFLEDETKKTSSWHSCEKKIGENGDVNVCLVPSFTVKSFFEGVKQSWSSIGITADIKGLFQLFSKRIFSVSYSNNPEVKKLFLEKLETQNITVGYPTQD